MGRPGIKKEDVVRAYVALLKQGRLPGPQNLRLELGRGSFTTIANHVNRLALRHVNLRPPRRRTRRLVRATPQEAI
ncbi:DNA-binding protein [Roseateles violae]|uniref:DNA-binding protein n=1 Tax=Roseateles violae TaxID=3058042 RepID=UPI003312FE4E